MEKLFLIKPDFKDTDLDGDKKYFCPPCTLIEGALSFYPKLREHLDIQYVDFARPREAVIRIIGEENQSCPVLVLSDGTFINNENEILKYLADKYGIGYAH